MRRLLLAFRCFFAILFGRKLPAEVAAAMPAPGPLPPAPAAPSLAAPAQAPPDGAISVLSLLQREGRLVDFLLEDIASYSDADVGAAVRDIHRGCRKVLGDYFAIEPVFPQPENAPIELNPGFDAGAVRLSGNVGATPPFRGVLRHHGWRATRIELPNTAKLAQPAVLAPAEVEVVA
jgi:hypothetical protein